MKRDGNQVFMDRADLIRMNVLVGQGPDFEGFERWFGELDACEQATLIAELCHSAYQAGVDDLIYKGACRAAGYAADDELVQLIKKVKSQSGLNIGGFKQWLLHVTPIIRSRALRLLAALYGMADERVRKREDRESCNHWWHRNLHDTKVVQSILSDPEYYKTTPRDD